MFLAFQTQRVPTDATGFPAPDARPLSAVIGNPGPTAGATESDDLHRPRPINPTGADPGQEVVVLANLATTPATLGGWTLTDRNGRATAVDVTIPAGAAMPIELDGTGVQLGNDGGNLVLHKPVDRYVRFRR